MKLWSLFNFCTIFCIFLLTLYVFSESPDKLFMPYNPIETTKNDEICSFLYYDTFNGRIKKYYSYLALKKEGNKLHIASEEWDLFNHSEISQKQLPLGNLTVSEFLYATLGIQLSSTDETNLSFQEYSDCNMRLDGQIIYSDFFLRSPCYLLHFVTYSQAIPFIDTPNLRVVGMIFLNDSIPFLGIERAKFFTLKKSGDEWIRTNTSDAITISFYKKSTAATLHIERPWSKLIGLINEHGDYKE